MPDEPAPSTHDRLYAMLLDIVRSDHYPSTIMLDILERGLRGPEREEFADVLMEKVTADRFPSIPMIERLARLAG